ncbi:hypothetical protein GCM10009422_20250 [Brevundimonas kwangchunensis]|uniref:Restriction endonuclease n=1 Tax=Brevundimonas kwangchunensis TaxID=322163 RepID=A0ABP3S7P5_9CAUL
MNTLSINLRHRPLRIGWCVEVGDFDALREAMRLSFVQWGGRYNPIIPIGNEAHANALVRLYRVDALHALSDTAAVRDFVARQTHLPWPLFHDGLFVPHGKETRCQVVDLHHPIAKLYDETVHRNPDLATPLHLHEWDPADPLADVFLATYGGVPSPEVAGTDYVGLARTHLLGQRNIIALGGELPLFDRAAMTFASLNRVYVEQHYVVQNHWASPSFYVGHADSFDDVLNFWNLRACDIPMFFYDERHAARSEALRQFWDGECRRMPRTGMDEGHLTLWHRRDLPMEDQTRFGENLNISAIDEHLWNGFNIQAPVMFFGESTSLASLGESSGKTTVSFAIGDRPFSKHFSLDQQRYVLSVDPGIGLFGNEQATFHLPFLPALNEFYGRNCHFEWDSARAEPESLGIVTTAADGDMSLRAVDVSQLIAEIFGTVGIEARPSDAGKIVSTLIRQMGGLDDCRAFKIEGVRRLIESHRPDQSFSRSAAMQTIFGQGTTRPLAEYQQLYIAPRPVGSPLTNDAVLKQLLEKGVFRPGLEFDCPSCTLSFWTSLDDAKSSLECDYCGHRFAVSSQLRDKDWAFRRSGLFGRDDHQAGGIPVALTLQQLVKLNSFGHPVFAAGMTLRPAGAAIHSCETDFVVVARGGQNRRIQVVIGESKTRHPITADDVRNLTAVANAFPADMFDVFIAFARLTPFTDAEVDLIRPINDGHRQRAIMLTARELEPYFLYERTAREFDIDRTAVSFEDMARVTDRVFFQNLRRPADNAEAGGEQ